MTSRTRLAKSAGLGASSLGKTLRAAPGFSLVELLCVLVILIILTVMLDNRLSGSRRRTAQELCRKNLQTISLVLTLYANDNHGAFPFLKDAAVSSQPLSLLLPRSTTETEMFICPGSRDQALPEGESFAQRRISYAYYMGRSTNNGPAADAILSDWQLNTLPKTKGQPLFSPDGKEPANNHDKNGGNLLLGDGGVIRSGPAAARDLPVPPGVTLLNPLP
jgi:type II secretory pathway pseudopilin PulG